MQAVPLHLAPGSDLRRSLEEFAVAHASIGFVLGVVGDLSQAAFQCPGQPNPSLIEGDLEIITLNGTVAPQGVHLHLSLSDGTCQVWAATSNTAAWCARGPICWWGWWRRPRCLAPQAPPRWPQWPRLA